MKQQCFVSGFLFPEYNEDLFHCFAGRAEKGRVSAEGKILFHPKTRVNDLHTGSRKKEYCKLERVSALFLRDTCSNSKANTEPMQA